MTAQAFDRQGVADWLINIRPGIREAVDELNRLRDIDNELQVAKEYVKGYVREWLDLDELDEDPTVLEDVRMLDDDGESLRAHANLTEMLSRWKHARDMHETDLSAGEWIKQGLNNGTL